MQKINFTAVPNAIISLLPILSGSATKVALAICRRTIGWHKDTDDISFNQIHKDTKLHSQAISKAVLDLEELKIIVVVRNYKKPNNYTLNFDNIDPEALLLDFENQSGCTLKIKAPSALKIKETKESVKQRKRKRLVLAADAASADADMDDDPPRMDSAEGLEMFLGGLEAKGPRVVARAKNRTRYQRLILEFCDIFAEHTGDRYAAVYGRDTKALKILDQFDEEDVIRRMEIYITKMPNDRFHPRHIPGFVSRVNAIEMLPSKKRGQLSALEQALATMPKISLVKKATNAGN